MNSMHTQKNTDERGFTIIETLVAIFILLISITGPLAFAQGGLRASFVARDQVVAFYLAQDAIESIKNIRDNDALDGEEWLDTLKGWGCVSGPGGTMDSPCELDTAGGTPAGQTITPRSCSTDPGNTCRAMKFDDNDGRKLFRWSQETGAGISTSKFRRTVWVHEVVADREAQIVIEVAWDTNFFSDRRVVVQENIYNWVPEYTSGS